MFRNRKLIIATKHRKESVIAPLLEEALGVHCFTDDNFDTDLFGTFSGEVERTLDPIAAARQKCLRAMELNGCDLGVASEGSFGPHPAMLFVPAGDEFLLFLDKANNLEIIVRELSTSTNFTGRQIQSQHDLLEFTEQVGFPEHGIILRPSKEEYTPMHKGITDRETLLQAFAQLHAVGRPVYAETDMRAMYNPTRMAEIKKAAEKLVQKIRSTCPQCQMPGFGVTDAKKGLPCSLCGFPTNSVLKYISQCQHCSFIREDMFPHQKFTEEPTFCDFCNP